MRSLHLSIGFALQSLAGLRVSQRIEQDGGLVALVEGNRYPASGTIRLEPLRPARHYRVRGATHGFCRAAADGSALLALTVDRPSLLVLTSVI